MWHKLLFGKCLQFSLKWSHAVLQTVFEGEHEEQDEEGDEFFVHMYICKRIFGSRSGLWLRIIHWL